MPNSAPIEDELCAILRMTDAAANIYRQMKVFDGQQVAIGLGMGHCGSVAFHLGKLAALLGDREAAACHFELGLERDRALGAEPFVAFGQLEYARTLMAAGASVTRESLHDPPYESRLDESQRIATRLRMPEVIEAVKQLRAGVDHQTAMNTVVESE